MSATFQATLAGKPDRMSPIRAAVPIVSEGLAMLFEEQILEVASEYAHVDIADGDSAEAIACLDQDPADDGRWFFHSGDVPLWFDYTIGYRWAKNYAIKHGLSASDLAPTPATAITAHL